MKYEIKGDNLPVAICRLEAGESMFTESGGMSWMTSNMQMETTSAGGAKKALGRMLSGESLFMNIYTAQGGPGMIAFASRFPGYVVPFEVSPGNEYVFEKSTFLASEMGVELSTFFNKKMKSGLFSGEGFIMQKVSGSGIVFGEFHGSVIEYDLAAGQQLVMETGHLAAMSATCSIDTVMVKGAKNVLLGGEGLFNTVVTGPGHVWVQTMPLPVIASALQPYIVQSK